MFIILSKKEVNGIGCDEVINVIYGENESIAKQWITEHLVGEIERLSIEPKASDSDTKNVSYIVTDDSDTSTLIRKYKKVNRGYVYNTSEKVDEVVCSVRYLEFQGKALATEGVSGMWSDLNVEINNRVLKQLDKDSLFQVMNHIQQSVYAKSTWNKHEFTGMVSETIKDFKKELYSNVAKKMKRFGKKQYTYNSCRIEAKSKFE
jgi:hypothetical protein